MGISRKHLALLLLAGGACGHPARLATPEPELAPVPIAAADSEVAPPAVAVQDPAALLADSAALDTLVNPDSAADEATLTALEDLETLVNRGGPPAASVSGTDVASLASDLFNQPRGGAASASGPTYDIDVESFASHDRVQAYIDFFLGPARERFGIWLSRMTRYEGMARSRFASQGLPEDLVYLGLIESGFSNTAVSRVKAVGMWQFMAGTGRRYGLTVDQWIDERRDPFKATDAAARLLGDLNGEFGSWYLAAAAYNAGAGRISRGLRRLRGVADSVSDGTFFRLSDRRGLLRRETRDYVPKLIAAALIAKEPARYGFDSLPILQPLAFDEITVSEQTGLDVLARLADTAAVALLELNPQFFRGVTPPSRTVAVRVPRGTGTVVAQRWAELPASERVTVIEHIIARGETVSQIAKRYHVEMSFVLAANPRVKPRALRVGQRLVIPVSAGRASTGTPPRVKRATPPSAQAANARFHTVRSGESLWLLAQRFGVKVSDLRRWNDLVAADILKPGQQLIVLPPSTASEGSSASPDH